MAGLSVDSVYVLTYCLFNEAVKTSWHVGWLRRLGKNDFEIMEMEGVFDQILRYSSRIWLKKLWKITINLTQDSQILLAWDSMNM
jgi:hypothetical protein